MGYFIYFVSCACGDYYGQRNEQQAHAILSTQMINAMKPLSKGTFEVSNTTPSTYCAAVYDNIRFLKQ